MAWRYRCTTCGVRSDWTSLTEADSAQTAHRTHAHHGLHGDDQVQHNGEPVTLPGLARGFPAVFVGAALLWIIADIWERTH
jgi:hypothetical protein